MKNETKLLPCPFCGGEAELDCDNGFNNWFVKCKECGCKTPTKIAEYVVIEAWNTRKPMERILERLEEENMALFNAINKYQNNMHEDEGVFDRVRMLQHKKLSNHKAIKIVKEEGGIE